MLLLPSLTRRWSFLSQALGIMVDLDIGTESMRWMGDARFMLGFIKGLAANRNFSCRLRMKVVESDKVEMARAAREIVGNARGKKVLGQGTDPLVNGVKKVDLNGSSNEESSSSTAAHEIPAANGTHSTKGSGNMNGQAEESHGALPDAKPLEPDESWTTIESTGKKPAVKLQSPTEAMNSGTPGGWIDGEGMLYA